jgi:predicted enzyme related to lactoylglutathione lyase
VPATARSAANGLAAGWLSGSFTSFAVHDIQKEFTRMRDLGVRFTQEPAEMGPVTTAVFDDTCGNLIQLAQRTP